MSPPQPQAGSEPLFSERRRGSLVFWGLAVGVPLIVGYFSVVWLLEGIDDWQWYAGWIVIGVGFYAFVLVGFLGPIGGEFKHVRVDGRGVWVRRRLLPASQIGQVRVLSEGEAAAATMSSRIDGQWLIRGVATYNHFSSHGAAVYVQQQRPDGRRRPWLLATHHPDELAAAVTQVRDTAGTRPGPQG